MKRFLFLTAVPIICTGLVACSNSTKKASSDKGYVTRSNNSFSLQPYKEVVLENGLKIFFIRDNTLPRVSLTMMVKVGSVQEAAKSAGLNALTAYLLEQGSRLRTANQIANEFGQLGSSLEISPGPDMTTVYSDALSNSADVLLDLFVDIAMNPAFKNAEIHRMRSQTLAALQKKMDNPSSFADEKIDEFLYGDHPYGRDVNGTMTGLRNITKQDIIKHYLMFYRPNNASLAVVGKFNDDYESKVQAAFGIWTRRTIPTVESPALPTIEGLKVKLIVKRGLQQTQIRVAELGIARNNPDFLPLRLANEILGGSFASRLNQKVRDDLGLTYSIYSNFDVRKERGSFDISTFTKNETAGKTLEELLQVVGAYAQTGPEEKEVKAARNQLIGQFPRAIETSDRLAYNLMALDFYGISSDYLNNYNKAVGNISVGEANAAIKRNLHPANMKVIVYGDKKIILQFEKFKPEIEQMK